MEINFKGFQNTGIGLDVNRYSKQLLKNNKYFKSPPYVHLTLTTTLNDTGDKDKQIFGEILKRFPNYHNKDTINFFYDRYFSEAQKQYQKEFWLNGKPLILRDENLGVFSKLAQLFTKLSKMPDNKLQTSFDYLYSDNCKINFSYFSLKNQSYLLEHFHKPDTIRQNAKTMIKEFEKVMLEYFF